MQAAETAKRMARLNPITTLFCEDYDDGTKSNLFYAVESMVDKEVVEDTLPVVAGFPLKQRLPKHSPLASQTASKCLNPYS
eukprot:2248562-Amphidinium_carterae.2